MREVGSWRIINEEMMPQPRFLVVAFIKLSLLASLILPALAEEALPPKHEGKPSNYAQLWVDETATVSDEAVAETLNDLAQQGREFDHILVMTHGFDLDEQTSTQQLEWLSDKFLREFHTKGAQKIGLVGLQWHSATGALIVPIGGDYLRKVALARSAGRGPTRQLLLALQNRYPKAHLSLLGHSTGCDVMTAAVVPEVQYDGTEPFVPTYKPEQPLKVLMHALIGSDVEYDLYAKGKVNAEQTFGRAELTWQTMVPLQPDDMDEVLILRSHFIGRPAGGQFPKLTMEQLDYAVSKRRLFLDSEAVPRSHYFVDYLKDERVTRISDTLKFLANPHAPKPGEIEQLEKVLAAPDNVKSLAPYLDENCGTTFYALWRLERLLCGSSVHLTDGTIQDIVDTLRAYTQKLWRQQKHSKCATFRKGIFPTEKMMTKGGAPPWARPKKWK